MHFFIGIVARALELLLIDMEPASRRVGALEVVWLRACSATHQLHTAHTHWTLAATQEAGVTRVKTRICPCPSAAAQAEASEQLGVLLPRERQKQAYNKALLERFKHMPDVKRVMRHRHLPAVSDRVHSLTVLVLCTASVPVLHCKCSGSRASHINSETLCMMGCVLVG